MVIGLMEGTLEKALELVRMAKTGQRTLVGGDLIIIEEALRGAEAMEDELYHIAVLEAENE